MIATPEDRSPQPRPHGGADRRVIQRQAEPIVQVNSSLSRDDFDAAYQIAVTTGDDPALDGLILRHLLLQAARPSELLSLCFGHLNPADATITHRGSKVDAPARLRTQPTTQGHMAALAAHMAERGPRTPAPPTAHAELRRTGIPAARADDPVFYRLPVDTYDNDGYFVARRVRPMTRRRLTTLAARVRQHGGPQLSATLVRALSIRLMWAAGLTGDELALRLGHVGASRADHAREQLLRYMRSTSAERPVDRATGRTSVREH